MSLNIKNPEAHALATRLAQKTGETLTEAVTIALRERLERLERAETLTRPLSKAESDWRTIAVSSEGAVPLDRRARRSALRRARPAEMIVDTSALVAARPGRTGRPSLSPRPHEIDASRSACQRRTISRPELSLTESQARSYPPFGRFGRPDRNCGRTCHASASRNCPRRLSRFRQRQRPPGGAQFRRLFRLCSRQVDAGAPAVQRRRFFAHRRRRSRKANAPELDLKSPRSL